MQIKNSPQKSADTTLNVSQSDASTQIDAPPQIKIVEKEVHVPMPAPTPAQLPAPGQPPFGRFNSFDVIA